MGPRSSPDRASTKSSRFTTTSRPPRNASSHTAGSRRERVGTSSRVGNRLTAVDWEALRPRRNYSPWYSWMVKLGETQHEDPLPLDRDELAAWLSRRRATFAELLGPFPARVDPAFEVLETVE